MSDILSDYKHMVVIEDKTKQPEIEIWMAKTDLIGSAKIFYGFNEKTWKLTLECYFTNLQDATLFRLRF